MSKQLIEQRAKLVADAQAILGKADASKEDVAKAEQMLADSDVLKSRIDLSARAEAADKELRQVSTKPVQSDARMSADPAERAEQEMRAFRDYAIHGETKMSIENRDILNTRDREVRSNEMVNGTAADGGYFVPTQMATEYEAAKKDFSGVRQVARIIRRANGQQLNWPTSTDVATAGEIVGEAASIGSNTKPTLGQVTFYSNKFSSKLVQVSRELLEDSAFDMGSYLAQILGERVGRIQNTKFTLGEGHGSSEPNGIVTAVYATSGNRVVAPTGESEVFSLDTLLDAIYGIDPAYRSQCAWMFHNDTIKALRKLKVDLGNSAVTNQYLWQPSNQAGVPDSLLGYPVVGNNDLATMEANAQSGLFGNFKNYIITDIGTPRFVRDESYGLGTDVVSFIAFDRSEGNMPSAAFGSVKVLVNSAS